MWREGPTDAGAALGRGEEDGGLPPAPSSPSLSVYTPAVCFLSALQGSQVRGARRQGSRCEVQGPRAGLARWTGRPSSYRLLESRPDVRADPSFFQTVYPHRK